MVTDGAGARGKSGGVTLGWAPGWVVAGAFRTEVQVGGEGGGVRCFGLGVVAARVLVVASKRRSKSEELKQEENCLAQITSGPRTAPRALESRLLPLALPWAPPPPSLLSCAAAPLPTSGPSQVLLLLPGRIPPLTLFYLKKCFYFYFF